MTRKKKQLVGRKMKLIDKKTGAFRTSPPRSTTSHAGYLHIASPLSAEEITQALGISKSIIQAARRAIREVG